jgi:hypothetical protein
MLSFPTGRVLGTNFGALPIPLCAKSAPRRSCARLAMNGNANPMASVRPFRMGKRSGRGPLLRRRRNEGPATHRETLAVLLENGSARSATNASYKRIGIAVTSMSIKPVWSRGSTPWPHPSPRRPRERKAAIAALAVGRRMILGFWFYTSQTLRSRRGGGRARKRVGRDRLRGA